MPTMDIIPVPQLADNYAWLLRDVDANVNVVIHPSEVGPVIEFLQQRHWHLDAVLNTHHHLDHTGGNIGLKAAYGCEVIGAIGCQTLATKALCCGGTPCSSKAKASTNPAAI